MVVFAVQSQRSDDRVVERIEQQVGDFSRVTDAALDPTTGEGFPSAEALLREFLRRNVPGDGQLLLGYVSDRPILGAQTSLAAADLVADPGFASAVESLRTEGGDTTVNTETRGEVRLTAQPVEVGEGSSGTLVVVSLLDEIRSELAGTMRTYAIVATLAWAAVTALAGWLSGRLITPVRALAASIDAITERDLSRRVPETGHDDLAVIARGVNRWVARLEHELEEQRRLLDALQLRLHDPLSELRGSVHGVHGEDDHSHDDPDYPGATLARVLDQVERRTRLLGDLVLLERSRRPDFLARAPVDLAELTESLLATARGLADRDWRFDGADSALLPLDRPRMTLAMLRLVDNAINATAPGDVVAVGSSYDGQRAELWVRDSGAGVAVEDRARIFERFTRAGAEGAPDEPGFGLGLSVAFAVARAHGGRIDIEDAEPHGAVVVLGFPHRATPGS